MHYQAPDGKTRTGDKYLIQPAESQVTWLCGLYRIEDGFPVYTILTREPTAKLREIHDPMPLILPKDALEDWIKPSTRPEDLLPYAVTNMVFEKAR